MDIVCQCPRLTERKLCRRRTRLAGLRVGDSGAITDRPQAWTSRYGEHVVDHNRATLISFDRQGLHERVRSGASRPHYRLGADFFLIAEEDRTRARIGDTHVELEENAARNHAF